MGILFIFGIILFCGGTFTEAMLKCYHCISLKNESSPYSSDCDNSTILPSFLRPCQEWYLPGNGPEPEEDPSSDETIRKIMTGANATGHFLNDNSLLADELEMVCVKVTGFLEDTMHVLRGCMPAFLKDMMNRCENVDYDYETVDGVRIRNLRMCFCNEEACNSAPSLMIRNGIGIVVVMSLILNG